MKTSSILAKIMVVTLVSLLLGAEATAVTYCSVDVNIPIPDKSTIYSSLTVPDSFVIQDINVELYITHTWDADLEVFLIAPDGTPVELFSGVGGNNNNFVKTVLDDEADESITQGSAPFTGAFQPEGNLSDFDGMNAQGIWQLEITDDATGDFGTLHSWCLIFGPDYQPSLKPTNPNPPDGAENQPVDTCLSWDGGAAITTTACGGYTLIDSDEAGGPSFNDYWIDIAGTGTNLNLTDESYAFYIDLPFNFNFYGELYNQVVVSSNGTIYFQDMYMGISNVCIPGTNVYEVDSFIALYWDDLVPLDDKNVYYQIIGDQPNRVLVLQWDDVRIFGLTDRLTVQAQLFETSNDILLLYADPSSEAGSGATVGIQGDSSCGLQYLCNEAKLHSDLAVLFTWDYPTTWDVYLGTNPSALKLVATNLNEQYFCPCGSQIPCVLDSWTWYFWKVVTKGPSSEMPGPIWSFKTMCPVDLNHDGIVDEHDLDIFIERWLEAVSSSALL